MRGCLGLLWGEVKQRTIVEVAFDASVNILCQGMKGWIMALERTRKGETIMAL